MNKIFVAGGAGFIGSNFIRYILGKDSEAQILNFDKLTYSGNLENLRDAEKNPRYRFVQGDISDHNTLEKAMDEFSPDYVINFAAETHVDRSIHVNAVDEFVATNVTGVANILETVRNRKQIKKFVQVSTDEVYGALNLDSKEKFREDSPLLPNSPYSSTKAAGDLLCRAYFVTYGVPVVVTRSSNNYGPYQYPEKLIPFLILRLLEGKKLPLYGDGKYVRDWLYVMDNCAALELCLFKGASGEIYNVGADGEMPNIEIARLILKEFGKSENEIEFVADRPGHDRRYSLDSTKIRKELGWQPTHEFSKFFHETVQWYLQNQAWINRIRQRAELNPHIA